MKRHLPIIAGVIATLAALPVTAQAKDYTLVVSEPTNADAGWHRVVETLRKNHKGEVITFKASVSETLPALRKAFPRYACFVATPEEAGRDFVARVHRLTRQLDSDIYTDCQWGIVTGYDSSVALRIASENKPLTIRKAAAGTEIPLDDVQEGVWFSELKKNHMVRKTRGGQATLTPGPDDTTEALATTFNKENIDLFITSGHATERDWQIGYAYRNGYFRCEAGNLFGLDTARRKIPISSPNPKVFLPVGNCLMGHVDGKDAMALSFMNSGGVRQMIGYTKNTWFGYGGWGLLDYFVEQPGRFTLSEAFYANQQALLNRLSNCAPELATLDNGGDDKMPKVTLSENAAKLGLTAQDAQGLFYDRDIVAFYGDPAWQARLAEAPQGWEQKLTQKRDTFTFEIKPRRGADSFKLLNSNGSQRGRRPFFQMLPRRIGTVTIVEGSDLKPVVTDNFLMVPNPGACDHNKTYRVVFRARPL